MGNIDLNELFLNCPSLSSIRDTAGRAILSQAAIIEMPVDTYVFRQGDLCQNYLLLLEGSVRVSARTESGREIVLYHIQSGGSCVLTTSCLMGGRHYPAEGVTETAVRALAISAEDFNRGLAKSETLRSFVFESYAERMRDLIMLVEEVAFSRIDVRLARHLLLIRNESNIIDATHQVLALELGTAREVVSRQLKDFERRGWISQKRGQLTLLQESSMKQLSESET